MLRARITALAMSACSIVSSTVAAQAPLGTVHLDEPECASLPFQATDVRALLALELAVDGIVLVEDAGIAEVIVAYAPDPCVAGATRFVFHLSRGGALRLHDADVGAVPLATIPRALALELAEALRGSDREREQEARVEPTPPAPPPPELPEAEVPIEPRAHAGPPVRVGVAASVRNTPDTSGTLVGAMALVDLPLADALPLVLRVDVGAAFGPSAYDLVLGSITGGVTLSVWARALHALAVRLGPRLWVGYGWAFDADARAATRQSDDLQVGVGVVAAGELALSDALALVIEGEAGTNLLGLDYALAMGRSGFVGAYWGADLALAWRV